MTFFHTETAATFPLDSQDYTEYPYCCLFTTLLISYKFPSCTKRNFHKNGIWENFCREARVLPNGMMRDILNFWKGMYFFLYFLLCTACSVAVVIIFIFIMFKRKFQGKFNVYILCSISKGWKEERNSNFILWKEKI